MLEQFKSIYEDVLKELQENPDIFLDAYLQQKQPHFPFALQEKITTLNGLIAGGVQVFGKILTELHHQGKLEKYVEVKENDTITFKSTLLWNEVVQYHQDFRGGKASDFFYTSVLGRIESRHESAIMILKVILGFLGGDKPFDPSVN